MENKQKIEKPKPDLKKDKKTNDLSQFSDTRLTVAAIFAFLPNFGIIGVHNFILRQYGKCLAHMCIVVGVCAIYFSIVTACEHSSCSPTLMWVMFLPYLALSSYVWAIVEGVQFLQSKNKAKSAQPVAENGDTNQETVSQKTSKPEIKAGDTGYFVAGPSSAKTVAKMEQDKKKDNPAWSILSILATLTPIFLFIYCLIYSGGSGSENGAGAIWWLMIMYYWTVGFPLVIASIVFGFLGLRTSTRWLAITSLVIKILTILAALIIIFPH